MGDRPGRTALIFPGQGAQFVGMGKDIVAASAEARAVFDRADALLADEGWGAEAGQSLSQLCFGGPEERLNDTANTQPAVYVTTYALWQAMASRLGPARSRVAYAAGHSLGEFSALAVAGAFSFEDGLRLVRCRGEAMRDAGALAPGGMAAILGLEDPVVREVVETVNGGLAPELRPGVWVANLNAPGQVVIAGRRQELEQAMVLAKERKAKRAIPLAVSVACHTPLMAAAAERLAQVLAATRLQQPWVPVISNATALPTSDPEAIKAALLRQLTSPVRWVESVQTMVAAGAATMLEIGPRSVVAALVGRISPAAKTLSVTDAASVAAFSVEALEI